jgi:hypothetical protein
VPYACGLYFRPTIVHLPNHEICGSITANSSTFTKQIVRKYYFCSFQPIIPYSSCLIARMIQNRIRRMEENHKQTHRNGSVLCLFMSLPSRWRACAPSRLSPGHGNYVLLLCIQPHRNLPERDGKVYIVSCLFFDAIASALQAREVKLDRLTQRGFFMSQILEPCARSKAPRLSFPNPDPRFRL